jgi:hypothetical protein
MMVAGDHNRWPETRLDRRQILRVRIHTACFSDGCNELASTFI